MVQENVYNIILSRKMQNVKLYDIGVDIYIYSEERL